MLEEETCIDTKLCQENKQIKNSKDLTIQSLKNQVKGKVLLKWEKKKGKKKNPTSNRNLKLYICSYYSNKFKHSFSIPSNTAHKIFELFELCF